MSQLFLLHTRNCCKTQLKGFGDTTPMVLVIFPASLQGTALHSASDHKKEKDNKFSNNSLKACEDYLYMQNQMRAVCTECIMSSHIMSSKTSQMESVDRTTDRHQTLLEVMVLLLSPEGCTVSILGPTQRRTLFSFLCEVKDLLLVVLFQSWENKVSYSSQLNIRIQMARDQHPEKRR